MRICDQLADAVVARELSPAAPDSAHPVCDPLSLHASATSAVLVSICRWMSQGLLLLLVCALPWWFGGIQPFAQFVCSLAVLAAAILTVGAQLFGKNQPH